MSLPAFIWPSRKNRDETASVRTGRVLHWTGAGAATLSGLFGLALLAFGRASQATVPGFIFLIGAAALLLIARGVRYILASE